MSNHELMIEEKQNIIDFLLESNSEVDIFDISDHCRLETKIAEKYLTILVLSGVVKMQHHIGQSDLFSLR